MPRLHPCLSVLPEFHRWCLESRKPEDKPAISIRRPKLRPLEFLTRAVGIWVGNHCRTLKSKLLPSESCAAIIFLGSVSIHISTEISQHQTRLCVVDFVEGFGV